MSHIVDKGMAFASFIQAGCERLFETTDVDSVTAYIKLENRASIRAFARAGFEGFDEVVTYGSHETLVGVLKRGIPYCV